MALAQPSPAARRFALVIGVNDGGASRLRFAASDARSIAQVLGQLGGVAESDMLLLLDPDRARIFSRLEELARRLGEARATARRLELILYYSGHSDEEGLLVRGERIAYADLRGRLDALPADLRAAILDSCASGALTRFKGGTQRRALLLDESSSLKGHVFLTSSAADEVAQESDRVGGSFFTHYLLSAMRGAADFSRSGRVTLTDAYGFAFQETLARTERTQGGAQHPSYEIQLRGTGDPVLTDLRSTKAGLLLGKKLVGRVDVHDEEDRLVVELRKQAGREVELGLPRGSYRVVVDEAGAVSEARVVLEDGRRESLDASGLQLRPRELALARGEGAEPQRVLHPVFRAVSASFSAVPGASLGVGTGGGFFGDDTTSLEATVQGVRERQELSRTRLGPAELAQTPGSQGDALKVVEDLPGVARTSPLGGGPLVIRGSNPVDSGVFLDGHQIPLLYHFNALASTFNSDLIESIDYLPGNFGADHGDLTGGMVDVKSRGPRSGFHGYVRQSFLDGSLLLEGSAPDVPGLSFAIAGRRSWIDLVLKSVTSDSFSFTTAPQYYDAQLKIDYQPPGSRHSLSLLALVSDDKLGLLFKRPADNDPNQSGEAYNEDQFSQVRLRHSYRTGALSLDSSGFFGTRYGESRIAPSLDVKVTRSSWACAAPPATASPKSWPLRWGSTSTTITSAIAPARSPPACLARETRASSSPSTNPPCSSRGPAPTGSIPPSGRS